MLIRVTGNKSRPGLVGGIEGRDQRGRPATAREAYNPASNVWSALPAAPLHGRLAATSAWTGRQMIAGMSGQGLAVLGNV